MTPNLTRKQVLRLTEHFTFLLDAKLSLRRSLRGKYAVSNREALTKSIDDLKNRLQLVKNDDLQALRDLEVVDMRERLATRKTYADQAGKVWRGAEALLIQHPKAVSHPPSISRSTALLFHEVILVGDDRSILSDQVDQVRGIPAKAEKTDLQNRDDLLTFVEEFYGPAVREHLAKVMSGEVGVCDPGPRGYAEVRESLYGKQIRAAKRSLPRLVGRPKPQLVMQ